MMIFSAVSELGRYISQKKLIMSHPIESTPPLSSPLLTNLEIIQGTKWLKHLAG
jgi:hypothetical protein